MRLASELGSKLEAFSASWQLHCGLAMEPLWTTFRPAVAKDLDQLRLSHEVKYLAKRFDALRWVSGISIQALCSLQRSIVGIHDTIVTASPHDLSSFEVGSTRRFEVAVIR